MLYHLSYSHHKTTLGKMARQQGLEPRTCGLEGRCSIRLSYWRKPHKKSLSKRDKHVRMHDVCERLWYACPVNEHGSGTGTRTPDTRIMIPML